MRILLLGANGQVGYELLRALRIVSVTGDAEPSPGAARNPLPKGEETAMNPSPLGRGAEARVRTCEVIPATRDGKLADGGDCERIDLADLDGLRAALDRIAPDLIVNAAAYTAVDRAQDEADLAMRINGAVPGVLGEWAMAHDARVLHYSTDYVFDGTASRPYREDEACHPLGVYGNSKLAGEIALRESGARYLILRTAWVYAARGHNFLRTMLRLAAEREVLRVVDDQIGAPTPAHLIADVTAQLIARWSGDHSSGGYSPPSDGIYHLAASGETSWCGFAHAIFERAATAGLMTRAPEVIAIKTADYPTRARRPAYSVLDTMRLRETFGVALPDWRTALDQVIAEAGSI